MGLLNRILKSKSEPKPGKVIALYDENFEDEVLRGDLPVVVDFWATWCMPCQVMGGLMTELAKEYANRVKVFKMNVDQCRRTAQAFGIRSIPTVVFFSKGKAMDHVVGLVPKNDLVNKFEHLIMDARPGSSV